jgi:hypothetical protein
MVRPVAVSVLLCASLSILLAATAAAQLSLRPERFEVVRLRYAFHPKAEIDDPRSGTFEEEVDVVVSELDVAVALPWRSAGGHTAIVNGLSYRLLDFAYKDWDVTAGEYQPDRFHALRYRFGLRRELTPGWAVAATARPGLVSDLEEIEADHVNVDGSVLVQRTTSRTRAFGFGVAYLNEFGEPLLLPLVEWIWVRSARQRIELLLPRYARWIYFASPELRLGVAAWVSGEQYRIGDAAAPVANATLDYSLVNLGVTAARQLSRSVELSIAGGLAAARRFEVSDDDGDTLRDLGLEQRAFLHAGLSVRR